MTLQKRQEFALAEPLASEHIARIIQENYGEGINPAFDRVRVPTGGGLHFSVPGVEQPEVTPHLDGVILFHHAARGYWPGEFAGREPPQCSSVDGVRGYGNPGGECAQCPYNRWGSDERGRGKACKEMRRVYILRSGEALPVLLSLPPTSLQSLSEYANRLLRKGIGLSQVVTRASLVKEKNRDGIEYSRVVFQAIGEVPQEVRPHIRRFAETLRPYVGLQPVAPDEYVPDEEPQAVEEPLAYTPEGEPLHTAEEVRAYQEKEERAEASIERIEDLPF